MLGVQDDAKKVVSGLAVCTADVHNCGKDKCPYWEKDHCEYELMSDAFDLIVSLLPFVPHVMTLEEALASDECWFEWKDGPQGYAEILCDYKDTVDINRIRSHGSTDMSIYGKAWRCWNHKPTEEQRKAEKWDR